MDDTEIRRPDGELRALAALAVVVLVLALRFGPLLLSPALRTDERVYLQAFAAVAAGESPYRPAADALDFFYPPPFAAAGALALGVLDPRSLVLLLRALNLLGLATTVWLSARVVRPTISAALVAALAVALVPPVGVLSGLGSGNLSLLVAGATLAGLAVWRRRPLLAGLLLGGGVAVKPLATSAIVALGTQRTRASGRSARLATGVALATLVAGFAATPFLDDYVARDFDLERWPLRRSVSLLHLLWIAGWRVSPVVVIGLVALATALWARRRERGGEELLFGAIAASTLGAPALWSHSMLMALPLATAALRRAVDRRRSGGRAHPLARWEIPMVVVATAAILFWDGIGGGTELLPRAWRLVLLAVPVASPPALALYLARTAETARSASGVGLQRSSARGG